LKKVTLLGFICLAMMLAVMSFAACAEQAAAPPVTVTGPGGTVTVSAPAGTVTATAPAKTVTVTATPPPAQAKEPTYTVLDPRSWEPPYPYQGLAPRLTTLEGKKIIVVNVRGGNEEAILSVGPALKKAVPSATVDVYTTVGPWSVLPPEWEKFKGYDAAIFGHNY